MKRNELIRNRKESTAIPVHTEAILIPKDLGMKRNEDIEDSLTMSVATFRHERPPSITQDVYMV